MPPTALDPVDPAMPRGSRPLSPPLRPSSASILARACSQAQDLVLARAVLVSPDGVATVRSGTQAYHVHPRGGCTCLESHHQTPQCHTCAGRGAV